MAEFISKITLPDGKSYEIKDLGARQLIQDIAAKGISFAISTSAGDTPLGISWTKGDTLITGTLAPSAAVTAIYLVPAKTPSGVDIYAEYICVKSGETYVWEKLGTTETVISNLGDLAYKNSVSGSVEVINDVSANFHDGIANISGSFTPEGSVAANFSGAQMTVSGSVTPKGTVATTLGADVAADVSITYKPTGTVTGSFLSGSITATGQYTPKGTINKPNVTVTASKTTAGASKVVTNGSVVAGTAPSFTEGAFTAGSFTQGTDNFVAPTLTTSVDGETLTINFTAGSFTQGKDTYKSSAKAKDTFTAGSPTAVTLPTFNDIDIISDVTAALASAPTFTGTDEDITVTGVSNGSITDLKFVGTSATLSTSAPISGTINSEFTGTAATVSLVGTPTGTISATFTGSAGNISGEGAVTGAVTITTSTTTKNITSK